MQDAVQPLSRSLRSAEFGVQADAGNNAAGPLVFLLIFCSDMEERRAAFILCSGALCSLLLASPGKSL